MNMKNGKLRSLLISVLAVLILMTSCNRTAVDPADSVTSDELTSGNDVSNVTGVETEPSDPVSGDLELVSGGVANYKLLRPSETSSNVIESAGIIYAALKDVIGVEVEFKDDFIYRGQTVDPNEKAILVGITNRAESTAALDELAYGDYTVKKVGNKVVITAWDDESLRKACLEFQDYITKNGSKGELKYQNDYSVVKNNIEEVKALPHYTAEQSSVRIVDLADDSYMIYVQKTTREEFDTYLSKVANSGFSQFSKREVGENVFATYKNRDNVINMTYTQCDKNARITIDKAYDMTILEDHEYKKICEPTVTMVGLETYGGDDLNQIGLLLVFKLEDGRLIVVDGGGYYNECITIIYNNLKKLAEDPNDITIAAWFFTHAHGDHTGGFNKFAASSYGKKVKVQNFIYNFTTYDQYEAVDKGPDHGRADQTRETCSKYYPDANIIKIHTGQVIKAANAEIEVLYTFDDVQPARLTYHNTTSLVFRYKNKADGYTVMCLGDAYTVTSARISRVYGTYLKSDMVQIAHHGYVGGTTQLYKNISATVNIWPGGLRAFEGSRNLKGEAYNSYALSLPSVKESFIAGSKVYTFPIPYTPDPSHQNTIIKEK